MDVSSQAPYRLSVSIVLYRNPPEQVKETLDSLYSSTLQAREQGLLSVTEITLVDNSCDAVYGVALQGLLEHREDHETPKIEYRVQSENSGFGAGHNTVLGALDSDVHLILNPDVRLEENALEVGLSRLRNENDIALLSPRVTGTDGRQEFLCKRYPSVLVLLLRAFAPAFVQHWFRGRLDQYEMVDLCRGEKQVEVPLASGCFMLVPTPVLKAVGGFDPQYFLYFEDFDLSLRLGEQGRLVFDPAMRIIHHGGYAASKGLRHVWYFARSGFRFFNHHGWRWI